MLLRKWLNSAQRLSSHCSITELWPAMRYQFYLNFRHVRRDMPIESSAVARDQNDFAVDAPSFLILDERQSRFSVRDDRDEDTASC